MLTTTSPKRKQILRVVHRAAADAHPRFALPSSVFHEKGSKLVLTVAATVLWLPRQIVASSESET
jgi:hypothetical protein